MNMSNSSKVKFYKTVLFGAGLVANAAITSAAEFTMEEVIVTAQKKAESMQDTPISMTALRADDIEARGVVNISDLLTASPGLTGFEAPSSRGNVSINIRGVGSGNANSVSTDPANAIYIDGVFLGKSAGNGVDVMDLERIEVLMGPQGTLYGRNSTGGAINMITKKPSDELGMKLKVGSGDYGHQSVSGRIDLPLSDDLSLAVSMYDRTRDGLYENTREGGADFENINRSGHRIMLDWDLSENFNASYSFVHNELDEHAQALNVVGFNPLGGGIKSSVGYPHNVSISSTDRLNSLLATQGGLPYLSYGPPYSPISPGQAAGGATHIAQLSQWITDYAAFANGVFDQDGSRPSTGSSDSDLRSIQDVDAHSLTLSWTAGDVEFKSITGIREVSNQNEGDLDGMDNTVTMGANGISTGVVPDLVLLTIGGLMFDQVGGPYVPASYEFAIAQTLIDAINNNGSASLFSNYATIEQEQFSQEFQMVGSKGNLDYVLGAYYFDEEADFRNNQTSVFPIAFTGTTSYDVATESTALYGQMTYRADDSAWAYTAGLRYTEEEKNITYLHRSSASPACFFGFFCGQAPGAYYVDNADSMSQPEKAGVYGKSASKDFDNLSGKLSVQYFMNEDTNLYASYSTGYRSGGFNGDSYDAVNDRADAFDEEEITSMEVGFKSDLMDGRARLNASFYKYEYENLQVSQLLANDNGTVSSSITNSGIAKRDGLETSLMFSATENMLVSVAYTVNHGDFEQYPALITDAANGGAVMQTSHLAERSSPDSSMNFNIDWTLMRGANSNLHWTINGNWQEESTPISLNSAVYNTDAVPGGDAPVVFEQLTNDERTIVNTRLAWTKQLSDSSVTIALWGRNITDDDHRNFSFNYGDALGTSVAQYGEPRVWGVDFTWEM
jgi:iron complex outermembrane receptor protein